MPRVFRLKHPRVKDLDGTTSLELTLEAWIVRPKLKTTEAVVLKIEIDRPGIACLLGHIRDMHDRDLERLKRERDRLDRESTKLVRV